MLYVNRPFRAPHAPSEIQLMLGFGDVAGFASLAAVAPVKALKGHLLGVEGPNTLISFRFRGLGRETRSRWHRLVSSERFGY
jgi:hypothetical protein